MLAKILLVIFGTFFLSSCTYGYDSSQEYAWPLLASDTAGFERIEVKVGDNKLILDIADEAAEKSRGLADVDFIGGDGMFFVIDPAKVTTFWMKNVRIPLDIVWISDGRIIGVEENVPIEPGKTESELMRYSPPSAVDAVIEVGGGMAASKGLVVGSGIDIINLLTY